MLPPRPGGTRDSGAFSERGPILGRADNIAVVSVEHVPGCALLAIGVLPPREPQCPDCRAVDG